MTKQDNGQMNSLLSTSDVSLPELGDHVEGIVLDVQGTSVYIDINNGLTMGIVRGYEMQDESGEFTNLKPGQTVTATVVSEENEKGQVELSFRVTGHLKAWTKLEDYKKNRDVVDISITEANKGGLMIKLGNIPGFLPVSQLTTEHYPRVEGGNKAKILEKLKSLEGKVFKVRVLDVDEGENKLIVSEKAAWEEIQIKKMSKYKEGDIIEGRVSGVVKFGAFIEFGEGLEGLVHISELDWKRIDDPSQYIKVGENVKAKIIAIEPSRISLSVKALKQDPWKAAASKYSIGEKVKGEVLKINPFGLFVKLDSDIHGLAHVSELPGKGKEGSIDIVNIGDRLEFVIISIEPDNHRLGLSIKAKNKKKKDSEGEKDSKEKDVKKEEEKDVAEDKGDLVKESKENVSEVKEDDNEVKE